MAAPTGSAAVYVYQLYTTKQFESVVTELNQEISKFNTADMNRVLEYDKRLSITKTILDNHVSLGRALAILEANTAESVAFMNLIMKRTAREVVTVESMLLPDSLDAAMFQRDTYQGLKSLASSSITDIKFTPGNASSTRKVDLRGRFMFKAGEISFIPDGQATSTSVEVSSATTPPSVTTSEATSTAATNSSNI
jgi:urease beta subunit